MGACSSVPSEPSLPQVLWEAFGAVPVLPFQPGLTVFSVLVKDKAGCFCQIGDLGSLCAGEGQANLQNLIANTQSITKTQELGSIDQMVANSSRLSSRLLVFQTGAVAGLENVHTWRISVPSHQRISADAVTVAGMLREFILDKTHPDVKGKKKMAVWVVTELITAPSVSAYAFDGRGVNIGVGISLPNGGVPADLEISLRGEGVATQFLFRKGPEVNGTPQPSRLQRLEIPIPEWPLDGSDTSRVRVGRGERSTSAWSTCRAIRPCKSSYPLQRSPYGRSRGGG